MSRLSDFVGRWLAGEVELAPITRLLGIRPVSLGDGEARLELAADGRFYNAMGTVHGGILCDLADVAMGAALATVTADGESFTTLQLQTSYFHAVVDGRLSAHARVVRRGRGTAHLECDLWNGNGDGEDRLVARATSVLAIRRADPPC